MKTLLLGNLVACAALVGLIWTVQVVVYPQFARVGAAEWMDYHDAHSALITLVVGPLMLAEAALAAGLVVAAPAERRIEALVSLALVVFAWAWTAFVSVPLHGKLDAGWDASLIQSLITTNWARTLAWSARLALLGWWVERA